MSTSAVRPTVSVFDASAGTTSGVTALPAVFTAPIRPDVVNHVHTQVNKNKRQSYAVAMNAGMQTAAESWGTGRAVSRIPRVPGGGTHRSGQGAFGNMCRGGRMFNPSRIWRKWHRKISKGQKRYAVCSALAASALPALVMARGHHINSVPEMPLVIGGDLNVAKTKEAIEVLKRFGAYDDCEKVINSRKVRRGHGKSRNRRYVQRKGPVIIYAGTNEVTRAYRNIPGIEFLHVERLNILKLAPGGHVGRFCIWTQEAFEKLDSLYGTHEKKSELKKGFSMPRPVIANGDISRVINSDDVQKVLRPAQKEKTKTLRKKNPLKNLGVMVKLNPYALTHRRAEMRAETMHVEKKQKIIAARRAANKAEKAKNSTKESREAFYNKMMEDL